MKRLAFAIGLLVLGFGAVIPARADFAVIKFGSGYCRVWADTAAGPQDGHYLWFRHHRHWGWHHHHHHHWGWHRWHYRFRTWEGADKAMGRAVSWHRCHH
jgi:hypothetical protein